MTEAPQTESAPNPQAAPNPQVVADEAAERAERDKQMSAAYTAASKTLRENHRDEFNQLYAKEAKARGYDWKPRLSEAEKAEQQMRELLAKHPELKDKIS
jgi:hypothetical protein